MKNKLKKSLETFGQAWVACLLAMVQGDMSVLTLYHAKVAAETGILTSVAYFACTFFKRVDNMWGNAMVVGLLTAVCDIVIHPTHFGYEYAEAVVTGLGAGALALVYHRLTKSEDIV